MSNVSKPYTFNNGTVANGTQVNSNFDTIYNEFNGNISDENVNSSGLTTYGKVKATSISGLDTLSASAGTIPAANLPAGFSLASAFPVGTVYINASVATNPATLLGFGTWVAFGAGKVLVGYSSGDSDFGTLGQTGGAKTASVAAHSHTVNYTGLGRLGSATEGVLASAYPGNAADISTAPTTNTVSGSTVSTIPPYITVCFWLRTV